MKLLSYRTGETDSYGALVDGGIADLRRRLGHPSLRAALARGGVEELARAASRAAADHDLSEVQLMVPVPDAEKIVCIGRNYRGHVAEGNLQLPKTPSVFFRAHGSFAPPGMPLVRPRLSEQFDYEGELALVIGRGGRHISAERAFEHIAGYTCFQDGSIRDYQFEHCLTVGKNFDRTGSIGPWLVSVEEIADISALTLTTTLNGTEVQRTKTDDFIFDIPTIVSYLSSIMELVPGDVIATGTPEGVGFARQPPVWLKPDDIVEVSITGIGILRNSVVAE